MKKRYLGVDRVTDVLSFPDGNGGDVAVCPQRVFADAKADRRDEGEYLAEVILHGILHLEGLRHGYAKSELTKLWKKQKWILKEAGLKAAVFRAGAR